MSIRDRGSIEAINFQLLVIIRALWARFERLRTKCEVVEPTSTMMTSPTFMRPAAQRACDGVYLVPAFQGLATPWWRPDVRAGLIGMTGATTPGHICHAGLEAICYQIRTVLDAVTGSLGHGIETVSADGGPTKSAYLMQLQADILQRLIAPAIDESVTPYGVALMAGLGSGLWQDLDHLRRIVPAPATVRPYPANASRWDDGYGGWRAATDALLTLYGAKHRPSRSNP